MFGKDKKAYEKNIIVRVRPETHNLHFSCKADYYWNRRN